MIFDTYLNKRAAVSRMLFTLVMMSLVSVKGSSQCVDAGSPVDFTVYGNNDGADYSTRYIVTDNAGTIISTHSASPISAPATAGSYKVYVVNYNTAGSAPVLTNGTNISAIGGDCVDLSDTPVEICVVVPVVPDLTPRILASPSTVHGNTTLEIVVSVREVGKSAPSSGPVTVRVRRNAKLVDETFAFNVAQTSLKNGLPVDNGIWTVDRSNPAFYIFRTDDVIAGNSQKSLVFTIQLQPSGADGVLSVLTSIASGNVGTEINVLNNNDDETLTFFAN